jgi:hypothetical protein
MSPTPLSTADGGINWNRHPTDRFTPADLDGDGAQEILVLADDLWTGILKWNNGALRVLWESATPLSGPAGDWQRNLGDDPSAESKSSPSDHQVVRLRAANGWVCEIQWQPPTLAVVTMTAPPPPGPPPGPPPVDVPLSGTLVISLAREAVGSFNYTAQVADPNEWAVDQGKAGPAYADSVMSDADCSLDIGGSGYMNLTAGTQYGLEGYQVKGTWSAQFSGNAVDLPIQISITVPWHR